MHRQSVGDRCAAEAVEPLARLKGEGQMISNKEAVAKARECAQDLLGTQDVSLEEIELEEQDGKKLWSITLGFAQHYNKVNSNNMSTPV